MYFNEYVGLDDVWAGRMTGVLTWGITFAMFFLGSAADRMGPRWSIACAFAVMTIGRAILAAAPSLGLTTGGIGSPLNLVAMFSVLFVVVGYGLYQPSVYAAVRQFTTEKTAAMGYAMLYAVNNLGGWLPSFVGPVRRKVGMSGVFWIYAAFTALGFIATLAILSRKTVESAVTEAAAPTAKPSEKREPFSFMAWVRAHPLMDVKFSFFIFVLIPVQTLFAHQWLTIPCYVERAYRGSWIGENFEVATNFNPLLIFILVPMVAAVTRKANVYRMMIWGTLVMAAPAFFLAIRPSFATLLSYLVLSTLGEAMWQPRFMQYAAEIAPPGRTAAYIGVAQFPWFLTKMITSLYSGWFLAHYCPESGPLYTERMWLWYGLIAMATPVALVLARGWVGKDFKTKSAEA